MTASGSTLLTAAQAAKILGFSTGWLARLRMSGGGPRYMKIGRKCRYSPADLAAWLSAHRVGSTSETSRAQREGWAA